MRQRAHKNEASEAKKNPGKWVDLDIDEDRTTLQGAQQKAWRVKNGDIAEFKDGKWDAEVDGRNVRVRYND
jgi:hypothetical protein